MTTTTPSEEILILDFGSQVTQLIARSLRESGVYASVEPFHKATQALDPSANKRDIKGIILSGGPASTYDVDAPQLSSHVIEAGIPILGICYGQMKLVDSLGGKVSRGEKAEFGEANLEIIRECKLFPESWTSSSAPTTWMSHNDRVEQLPEGFSLFARSTGAPFAIVGDEDRNYYGVQFHPEVSHTPDGKQLLENFARKICGYSDNWSVAAYLQQAIDKIRSEVGTGTVICGVSGGVDSTVTASLLVRALPAQQIKCVMVDNGLLRADEATEVESMFANEIGIDLTVVDASDRFLTALTGVTDPERKRKIIGKTFIDVFDEQAAKTTDATHLAQGTLYPDVIESQSPIGGPSVTIKSHHNVGGLPEHMQLKLVEPLRELFKDEVRKLGRELGLQSSFVDRHPFPGPGLAVRIPGKITEKKLKILRDADKIYMQELRDSGLYGEIWQAYAALLPLKSIGVKGDGRSYEYCLMLRAVTSRDGMTADSYEFDPKFLKNLATKLTNEVSGINRVVYDFTSKPPATIELE